MEGLKGTAIRSAVRNPSCPQAPVFARDSTAPGTGKGLLLQVAQATTTHNGMNHPLSRTRTGVSPSQPEDDG